METYIDKQVTTTEKVLNKVICNSCGKDITTPDIDHGCIDGVHADLSFGYGSNLDGSAVKFDLCTACVHKITGAFKHPPEWYDYF